MQSDPRQICGGARLADHDVELLAVRGELVEVERLVTAGGQSVKVKTGVLPLLPTTRDCQS